MLEINAIDYEDKHVLHNLMQLYRYDSSEFDGHELNIHGLYLYKYIDHQWTDTYRRPLMMKVNGEIAGFAEGMYREIILNEERWTGPIQVFGGEPNNTLKSNSI
ncbi:hypothetical protein ABIC22_003238 [Paenibacillus sp. PvP094]